MQLVDELRRALQRGMPDDQLPLRTLKELKVPEIGPVVWPAYKETSVSVRSIIDLGRLHEPEQRKLLAEAVFIADAAESQDDDAQRDTGDLPVDEHPESSDDAQQATPKCVGEHPSTPRGRRGIDVTLRTVREMLLTIDKKGTL